MPHSFGVDVASDWADKSEDDKRFGLYKKCGLWTMQEANLLYECARQIGGDWIDIGCHTGWTTAHIAVGVAQGKKKDTRAFPSMPRTGSVWALDPQLCLQLWQNRFRGNVLALSNEHQIEITAIEGTSRAYFYNLDDRVKFDGVCIDGDHEPCEPLFDARWSARHLEDTGVILLHDGLGRPVREAVEHLLDEGFNARFYETVHGVFVAWRGDFVPPEYAKDPLIPDLRVRCPEFDFRRMS